jgi:hypothetical protein
MKKLVSLFCVLMLLGCSASIQSTFENPKKPLTIEDKVVFLDIHHSVPKDAEKIGSAHFQDSGFSTDCDFNSNLIKARKLAREKGANVVKVTEKKVPDLWSTCYRIKVDFYYTTSDINTIPQYKLQIN